MRLVTVIRLIQDWKAKGRNECRPSIDQLTLNEAKPVPKIGKKNNSNKAKGDLFGPYDPKYPTTMTKDL